MQKKIIIIDDDPIIRNMYKTKFESSPGFSVAGTAENGKLGLELIQKKKPDFILLDIMMPKSDGFEVLEQLKKDVDLKRIPVIMLTNLAHEEDREQSIKRGAQDYLVKANTTPSVVLKRVKEILNNK